MKKRLSPFFALALVLSLSSLALANGLNLNSLGSRALAMGGAFVGLADDYSAIFWNPAGMAQFKTSFIGFYGTDVMPSGTYRLEAPAQSPPFGLTTVVDAKTQAKHYLSGLLAYYHPINDYLVAGIGIYVPAGLGAAWDGEDFANFVGFELGAVAGQQIPTYEWESRIGLVTIAPAVSYKINELISVGASLNINYGMFSLKRWAGGVEIEAPHAVVDLGQYEDSLNGWGFGATFGVLVKANETLSFGATVRTPSKINFKGESTIQNLDLLGFSQKSDTERDITWPWWIAAGVAFRPLEGLVLTGDLQWTDWSEIDEIETIFKDPYWNLFMTASGMNIAPMKWKDALQIRLGAEYMLKENLALRGGYYYDPTPAPDKTLNILLPTYTFNVFTLGAGYSLNGLVIDFGFEYLIGKGREVNFAKWLTDPEWEAAMPGLYDMSIVVPNISVSYKF